MLQNPGEMTEEENKGGEEVQKKGKAPKAPKADKEGSAMKPGDYTLHLLIQKAKDLDFGEGDGESTSVVCEVNVQDQKESTKVMENVSATTVVNFDSHVFIELF